MTLNKKAKKSVRPRASTGNTHHGMRYVSDKLFSLAKMRILFFKAILQNTKAIFSSQPGAKMPCYDHYR